MDSSISPSPVTLEADVTATSGPAEAQATKPAGRYVFTRHQGARERLRRMRQLVLTGRAFYCVPCREVHDRSVPLVMGEDGIPRCEAAAKALLEVRVGLKDAAADATTT